VLEKAADAIGRASRGLNDGKGFVFISHSGEVFPSGFLPLPAGSIRQKGLAEIYRDHSVPGLARYFEARKEMRVLRIQRDLWWIAIPSYALSGNPLAEEPCCSYVPKDTRNRLPR